MSSFRGGFTITLPCAPKCAAYFSSYLTSSQYLIVNYTQNYPSILHHWDFGDGTTSNLRLPPHTYLQSGNYTITHVAYNPQTNCSDTQSTSVIVSIPCNARFSYGGDVYLAEFQGNYQNSNWVHTWNFGDGSSTVSTANPSHTYSSLGTYTVTHTIYDNSTSCSTSHVEQILVSNSCSANFYPDTNALNYGTIRAYDSSTVDTAFTTHYLWETPNRTSDYYVLYDNIYSPGYHPIKLRIQNGTCWDTITKYVGVGLDCISPNIQINKTQNTVYSPNYQFRVNAYDTRVGTDYSWKLPDGQLQNGQYVYYTSITQDSVDLWLYWDNNYNCHDSALHRVVLPYDSSLTADLISIQNQKNGYTNLKFDFTGYITGGIIDYGDGTSSTQEFYNGIGPRYSTHWYQNTGTYTVKMVVWNNSYRDSTTTTVTVTDANQCYFSSSVPIGISNPWPYVAGQRRFNSYVVYNSALINSSNNINYTWDFGDSSTGNGSSLTHTYSYNNNFPIDLLVEDSLGHCSLNTQSNVTISDFVPSSCDPNFTINLISGSRYSFVPTNQNATSYYWDFGDGHYAYGRNAYHTYYQNGTVNVKLRVTKTGSSTCTDSMTKTLSLPVTCNSSFYTSQNIPYTVIFYRNMGYAPYTSSFWDFGDGDTAITNSDTISHTYSSNGNFSVNCIGYDSATATKNMQCTYSRYVTLYSCGLMNPSKYIGGKVIFDDTLRLDFDSLKVYLIDYDSIQGTLSAIDSVVIHDIDSARYYFTFTCHDGPFMVKAACFAGTKYYAQFLPTYSEDATLWSGATLIHINNNGYYNRTINMVRGINPGGPGFIGGYISQGANKNGAGLDGLQVNLYSMDDQAVAYTFTANAGRFEFSNLAYGKYKVIVEIPGKASDVQYVTLDQDHKQVDEVNFEVNEKYVGSLSASYEIRPNLFTSYPNPASTSLTIEARQNETINQILVYDAKGMEYTLEYSIESDQKIVLDIRSLKPGVYIVKAGNDKTMSLLRFVKN